MITDAEVEKALDYLRDQAEADAQARANAAYLEQWTKTVRAQLIANQAGISNAAATANAECHPDYLRALGAYREAVTEDYRRRFLREAAAAKLDIYRTQEASKRTEGRFFGNG